MRRTSRIRTNWPAPECQPPWDRLFDASPNNAAIQSVIPAHQARMRDHFGDATDMVHQPAIAHLPAHQIATQLVEVIQDEAGGLESEARRQVAQRIMQTINPWLRS